jgi:transposase
MNAGRFEEWVKDKLLPAVKKGSTIIMNNARFHRKNELEKIMKRAKVHLLFSINTNAGVVKQVCQKADNRLHKVIFQKIAAYLAFAA